MAKKRAAIGKTTMDSALDALDGIEPSLRHLSGLVTALCLLGEVEDSIEPIAISSLARCAGETLDEVERSWRMAIGALRQG